MKIFLIIFLLLLSGCASSLPLSCALAGECTQTESEKTGITGSPKLLTTKTSKVGLGFKNAGEVGVSMSQVAVEELKLKQIKATKNDVQFSEVQLTGQQIVDLAEDGERAYFYSQDNLNLYKLVYAVVDRMGSAIESMTEKQSDVVGVAKAWMQGVSNVSQDGVEFADAIANPLSNTLNIGLIAKGVEKVSDNQRIQGVTASEFAGDVSTTINANSSIGSSSNDPSGGAGGMGSGGSSTATTTSTIEGGNTFNINGRGTIATSEDSGRTFAGTRSTVQNDSSATGLSIDGEPNNDQVVATDGIVDTEVSNDPVNGSNNDADLF